MLSFIDSAVLILQKNWKDIIPVAKIINEKVVCMSGAVNIKNKKPLTPPWLNYLLNITMYLSFLLIQVAVCFHTSTKLLLFNLKMIYTGF